jgi:hypothetical protein
MLPTNNLVFGMYVDNGNYSISLGGVDEALIAKGSKREGYGIHWYPLVEADKNGWSIELQDARYGYMSFRRGSANKAVFSSGRKYIYIPQEDYKFLADLWQDKIASVNCKDREYCFMKGTNCSELY